MYMHKKSDAAKLIASQRHSKKGAATYSPALRCSTIGAPGLNFSVRDGKRWSPGAKATRVWLPARRQAGGKSDSGHDNNIIMESTACAPAKRGGGKGGGQLVRLG